MRRGRIYFGLLYIVLASMYIIFMAAAIWVAGSSVTSGVKTISKSCSKTYSVEAVFSGNWFCVDNKDGDNKDG